jgi:RNA polymerase sigma-70 factor (ECF subfamily)
MNKKISDHEILELCREAATLEVGFRHLMNKYKEKLYWQIKRILLHHDDTDEVLQIVWIKVWQNIAHFKGESAITTWLYRICYNESISYLQNQKKQNLSDWELVSPSLDHTHKDDEILFEEIDPQSLTFKVNKAIETLPPKQKQIFFMRYHDELSYHEIAAITGTSEGSLKASYHHAIKKIEEFVKNH